MQARIKNGKIVFKEPIILSKLLSEFQDKDVVVTVKLVRNKRSLNQNSYYWGVVIKILAELTGYGGTEMHDILRAKFLSGSGELGNEIIKFSRSTTELDTSEFEEYLTDIREWSSSMMDCFIPLPDEIEI